MKTTWPPLQCIRVGFESNQHGQAASQEQASSRAPLTFQEVFFSSASDTKVRIKKRAVAISERNRMEPPLSFSWRQAYRQDQERSAGSVRVLLQVFRRSVWSPNGSKGSAGKNKRPDRTIPK